MSKLKVSTNEFLEKQELNRLMRFLDEDSDKEIIKREALNYGLVKNTSDNTFTNGLIGVGSNPVDINFGYIKNETLFAIDNDGLFIKKAKTTNIPIPNDGNWYWVKVAHAYSPIEEGTLSVNTVGLVNGTNTKFTEVLRGRPNFPSRIKFYNSSNNLQEYEVASVNSDTSIIVSSATGFVAESNLQYSVIGTFTPGIIPPSLDKEIFQYDDSTFSLVPEITFNTKPAYISGKEFFLARVRVAGGGIMEVQDKREEVFKLKADYLIEDLFNPITNQLAGVTAIKFDHIHSTRDKNIIHFEWAFQADNWVIDTNTNIVTVLGGSGGRFKDPTFFTNNDFDGWRIYKKNGSFSRINSSVKSGSNINLSLDYLNPDDFIAGYPLVITPNAEEIEISLTTSSINLAAEKFVFPINRGNAGQLGIGGKIPALTFGATANYGLTYRYKTLNNYSDTQVLLDDSLGYYNESKFDGNGDLIVSPIPTRTAYAPSLSTYFLTLTEPTNSYFNTINTVVTGDLYGIDSVILNNAFPLNVLYIGTNREYQHFIGSSLTLTADLFIILKSTLLDNITPIKNGNHFFLHFKQKINLATFKLRIVSDFISPISYTLLKEFTADDSAFFKCFRTRFIL